MLTSIHSNCWCMTLCSTLVVSFDCGSVEGTGPSCQACHLYGCCTRLGLWLQLAAGRACYLLSESTLNGVACGCVVRC
jgi:hypothetical protein